VTVVVNDQQIRAQVVEVPISITSSDGVLVGAVVGDATGFDWQAILAAKQSKTEKRVSALEQNAENGASASPGLIPVTSGTFSTVNGSSSRNGSIVTFTNVSAINLNGWFTSEYSNYEVLFTPSGASAQASIFFRLRAGSDNSNASYIQATSTVSSTGVTSTSSADGNTYFFLGILNSAAARISASATIFSPFKSQETGAAWSAMAILGAGGYGSYQSNGFFAATTVFDGFSIILNTGTMSGSVQVLGYRA
jgi:hypothetical protein